MTYATTNRAQRPALSAGIAIGPILFVVAILAVLVAALAAGSGGFTASTTTDTARTNAAALIQQGQNIMMGAQRILGGGTATAEQVRGVGVSTTDTSGNGIFTAAGGGVPPQNPPGGSVAASAAWAIGTAYLGGVGVTGTPADNSTSATAAGADLVAWIQVTQTTCQQINRILTGTAAGYWIVASGGGAAQVGTARLDTTTNITNYGSLAIGGRTQACVANQADAVYIYYQLLSAS